MPEDFDELRDGLRRNTFVQDVKLESSTDLRFGFTPEVAEVITITLFLQSFVSTVGTKFAEESWRLVMKFFDHLKKRFRSPAHASAPPPAVRVSYLSTARSVEVEFVLSYRSFSDLKKDLRHHQHYLAIGLGYLQAELPAVKSVISLKEALPEERRALIADFQLCRVKAVA